MSTPYTSGMDENDSTVGSTVSGGAYSSTSSNANSSMHGSSSMQDSTAKMRAELSNLKRDLDDLMSRATSMSDKEWGEARALLMEKYSSMQHSVKELAAEASKQLSHGADLTSDYVKERPLQSVAIATGIGLLLGALLRR